MAVNGWYPSIIPDRQKPLSEKHSDTTNKNNRDGSTPPPHFAKKRYRESITTLHIKMISIRITEHTGVFRSGQNHQPGAKIGELSHLSKDVLTATSRDNIGT